MPLSQPDLFQPDPEPDFLRNAPASGDRPDPQKIRLQYR